MKLSAGAIPQNLQGVFEIMILGTLITVKIGSDAIELGGKIIKAGDALFDTVLHEVDNFIFAKSNPTGRRVKDVQKRLKKEGFEKVSNNGGSHERWIDSNGHRVTVPNHGSNTELGLDTLNSIWKQAGWK
ncbi:type II toxin-antitoxin system HicA family toxin [Fusibacter sp. 3D3]|uniref:type II toxin-antitoxin system HicA family toxin n=1 Tax=Fusibacter sp. 3D3 TaxID=1048380 RepID=UPI0008582A57|nr:type II toxin-antitoxin system HicA family toxin [Fusibacter sp. 3D3]GAU76528.1 hypothetical protein F3D3_1125 [Fusibacter sp. 3D3]